MNRVSLPVQPGRESDMVGCLSCICCENWQNHLGFKQTRHMPGSKAGHVDKNCSVIFISGSLAKSNSTPSALGLGSAGAEALGRWPGTAVSICWRVLQNWGPRAQQSSHKAHDDFWIKEKESKLTDATKHHRVPPTPCVTTMVVAPEARQATYEIWRYSTRKWKLSHLMPPVLTERSVRSVVTDTVY